MRETRIKIVIKNEKQEMNGNSVVRIEILSFFRGGFFIAEFFN